MTLNEVLKNTNYDVALFSEEARKYIEDAIVVKTVRGKSLKQSKKRGEPEKGRNNIATVSVAKKQYGIRHQAESAGKSSLKM